MYPNMERGRTYMGKYEIPDMEIIIFDSADIVTTSGGGLGGVEIDPDED